MSDFDAAYPGATYQETYRGVTMHKLPDGQVAVLYGPNDGNWAGPFLDLEAARRATDGNIDGWMVEARRIPGRHGWAAP